MKTNLLKETLEVLMLIRQELSNSAEGCVIQELDDLIKRLEVEIKAGSKVSSNELLTYLDTILKRLPFVIYLLNKFLNDE